METNLPTEMLELSELTKVTIDLVSAMATNLDGYFEIKSSREQE